MKKNSKKYSEKILELRSINQLEDAVTECNKAIDNDPLNPFYYRIKGDILLQSGKLIDSFNAYIEYLLYIEDQYSLFKFFIKYYRRLSDRSTNNEPIYRNILEKNIRANKFTIKVTGWLKDFFSIETSNSFELDHILKISNDNKYNIEFVKQIKELEQTGNASELSKVINYCMERTNRADSYQNDKYILSIIEKNEMYDYALKIVGELFNYDSDPTLVRTLLRICRKINDYSYAEKIMNTHNELFKSDNFNVDYELFYYHKKNENRVELIECLNRISSKKESIPINKTLYNFYLQVGMVDDAKKIENRINELKSSKKASTRYSELVRESEQGVIPAMMEIINHSEHNRQMSALRDLLKGFSHELGQPVTNIRYAIQFHYMKKELSVVSIEETDELLNKIMRQTIRIGDLLRRFSPIVSPKNGSEVFSIEKRFELAVVDLKDRLNNISVSISTTGHMLSGDPIQFDQIIYNLLLNSIQSIHAKGSIGKIDINVKGDRTKTEIRFSDDGIGIPIENHRKIFEPFFTTKDPNKGQGGDGLGMYIVWNLVRMFNGSIHVNPKHIDGAEFIIIIKNEKEQNSGKLQSSNH